MKIVYKVKNSDLSFPSDQCALVTVFDLEQPAQVCIRTIPRKPVGWRPQSLGEDLHSTDALFQFEG